MTPPYSLNIGSICCTVLADGYASYGMPKLMGRFPQVPESALREALNIVGEDPDHQTSYYNPLLIQTDEQMILVDGGETNTRHAHAGQTAARLLDLGLHPAEISDVIITHAHGDHILGLFEPSSGDPLYTNATHWINEAEWAFWTDFDRLKRWGIGPSGEETAALLRRFEKRLKRFKTDGSIFPGITPIAAYGHTLGHSCLIIENDGEQLFHGVDLVHSPIQFPHPEWAVKFDTDPRQARATRQALFEKIAEEQWLTLFYHLPYPGLGKLKRRDEGFAWQPI